MKKLIIVDKCDNPHWVNHAKVEILEVGKDGYISFSTHQENPLEYAKSCPEYKSGDYKLIIK